jgi:hypothetical protein
MSALMEGQASLKPRRRASVKASDRKAVEKVKATLILPVETSRRLTIYAAMTDADRSEVVAMLIDEHLKRFVVQDRDRAKSADQANPATEVVSAA